MLLYQSNGNDMESPAGIRFKLLVPRYGITAVTVPTNMFTGIATFTKFSQSRIRPLLGPFPG